MMRSKASGLLIGALTLVAFVGRGHAAETRIDANAAIKGEGRFYNATESLLLFSGYFEGAINVTQQQGDLVINAASMVCPGTLEVNRTDHTQQGEGRCIFRTQGGDRIYARWTCTGKPGEGCGGPFTVLGGTGKFSTISGQGTFMMQSTVAEAVVTIPEGGVTGSFTGKAQWSALKLATK